MKIMKTIIRQGTIVSPSEIYEADILIDGEKIACIGRNLESEGAKVIEARGKYVIPGGVDVHTHMDLLAGNSRAVDDFYDGTVAAACGGTTAIVDHMGFGPDGCNLHYQLNEYHHLADGKAVIDYGFHGTAQHVNQDILDELEGMMEDGVSSVKVYLTYDRRLNDGEALQVLKRMKKLGTGNRAAPVRTIMPRAVPIWRRRRLWPGFSVWRVWQAMHLFISYICPARKAWRRYWMPGRRGRRIYLWRPVHST